MFTIIDGSNQIICEYLKEFRISGYSTFSGTKQIVNLNICLERNWLRILQIFRVSAMCPIPDQEAMFKSGMHWRCNLLRCSVSVREVLQEVVQTCILKMELFEFCDCVGFLSLEKERGYMFEDIWTFSIKQKRVTWRWSFPLKKMESCLKCIWKTWRASWRRGEQVLVAI